MNGIIFTKYSPKKEFWVGGKYLLDFGGDEYAVGEFDVDTDGTGFFRANGYIIHLGTDSPIEAYACITA